MPFNESRWPPAAAMFMFMILNIAMRIWLPCGRVEDDPCDEEDPYEDPAITRERIAREWYKPKSAKKKPARSALCLTWSGVRPTNQVIGGQTS